VNPHHVMALVAAAAVIGIWWFSAWQTKRWARQDEELRNAHCKDCGKSMYFEHRFRRREGSCAQCATRRMYQRLGCPRPGDGGILPKLRRLLNMERDP
jgi:hypothetical protein